MQVTSFTRARWCFRVGRIQVIWMRRPVNRKTEHLIHISWFGAA